jgi:hypothetical protein
MTEPRHTADTITDDALDALYARIVELEHQAAIDTQVMEKADRECDEHIDAGRKFKAWGEEQHARAERAEAAIERVRALHPRETHRFLDIGDQEICGYCVAGDDGPPQLWPCETIAALDEPKEQPCQQHPNAPVIGGMCGGCTVYPVDKEPGLVDQHGQPICTCTWGQRCPHCRD